MIKKIITTAVISTALLMGANNMAQSKEIHLKCETASTEGRYENLKIVLNTESNMGSTSDRTFIFKKSESETKTYSMPNGTGKLYSDGSHYWFSIPGRHDKIIKYSINRTDLSVASDMFSPYAEGTCKIVEAPKTKI